jgi:hypothetical protein
MQYKELDVALKFRAEEITTLLFLVQSERVRILRESPEAFDNPGSWADTIDKIHSQLVFVNDSNLK